uniref:Fibronectin type III and ankyrin repeat domains 1 n=1 Tax=Naja naja TaxID=35670 RepID=A0A8C6VLQ9_NAJNA
SWNLEEQRKGPQEQWLKFSVEEEDPKLHKYGLIYTGYARQHVVEGLEPRTTYRFRLKVTDPKGESVYSSPICVTTTSEPMSGEQLHRAVSRNDLEDVIHILQGSLMIACFAGHLGIVQYLRSQGASWLSRDFGGCTAMHWATDGGHCDVIDWMIQDGCEVDSRDSGLEWTPLLRLCALSGKTDVATILINAGANVNVKDKDGKTPLMVCCTAKKKCCFIDTERTLV